GKTHLAVAILCEIIRKGYSGLYYNSPDLLRDIRATFDENSSGNEDELLQEITEVDLLVFDDLGAEKVSDFVLDRFYLIVNKRYEGCKPIIVTSNYDEEILRARFGDRILSRLDEMCARFDRFPKQDFRRLSLEKQLKLDSKNL
ncbi:ATP-binding protein, partial [Candidatus Sumerlaeota bacterium]|nr:ATP-binding protein [Candidatus Sumerlaeota bacterium]